jgi:hypothetical protein
MIFRRITRGRPVTTALVAGGLLVVIAVYGWGVPWAKVAEATWISFLLVALLIIPAALATLVIVLIRHYKNKRED